MAVKVTEMVIASSPLIDIMIMLIAVAHDGEAKEFIVKAQGFGDNNKNRVYMEKPFATLSDAYLAYSKEI